MEAADLAKKTRYAPSTVYKYAAILGISYLGIGQRKIYIRQEADIERFRTAIIAAGGSWDRRGEAKERLKKLERESANETAIEICDDLKRPRQPFRCVETYSSEPGCA